MQLSDNNFFECNRTVNSNEIKHDVVDAKVWKNPNLCNELVCGNNFIRVICFITNNNTILNASATSDCRKERLNFVYELGAGDIIIEVEQLSVCSNRDCLFKNDE